MPRRRRRLAARVRQQLRNLLAFLFSNVGIIVLVLGYTVAGAFMFQAIEGAGETERYNNMTRERENTAQYLWQNVTIALNLFNETALKHRIGLEVARYQGAVVRAARRGWDGGGSERQWSFSSAFLYSLTVITTIGYGHLSPRTSWGKLVTILYALLGMPLFLLYLSNVGELLARWFKCLYALCCLCRGCPGFTKRRVARLKTQVEISEAESIERPEAWGPRDPALSAEPVGRFGYYPQYVQRREDYLRSTAVPDSARIARHPGRGWVDPGPSDPTRVWSDPNRVWSVPARVWSDPTRGWSDPTRVWSGPARGWSGPVRGCPEPAELSSSSEFSYVTFDAQTITVPISVCVFILVGYVIFGSMIFGLWEKWDQLDGAYFCFISLSSIGFGDFVPGERVYTPRIETSFIVCSLYLLLGMALVAMCFNLMQEQVIHYFSAMKRALRRVCRCKR